MKMNPQDTIMKPKKSNLISQKNIVLSVEMKIKMILEKL